MILWDEARVAQRPRTNTTDLEEIIYVTSILQMTVKSAEACSAIDDNSSNLKLFYLLWLFINDDYSLIDGSPL